MTNRGQFDSRSMRGVPDVLIVPDLDVPLGTIG